MARNEEKANTMLSRFLQAKKEETTKPKEKRPYLASMCRDLSDADKWRQQILREIGKKVLEIQNPGLGEHKIRDLNDEINKLIREKGHWERRIIELGGPNYFRSAPKVIGEDGKEIVATAKGIGYKYFGAAKNLPGVKELFEPPPEPKKKRNRHELYKRINADYFGYRDDEDGVLEKLEAAAEKISRQEAISEWERVEALKQEARKSVKSGEVASVSVPNVQELNPIASLFENEEEETVDDSKTAEGDREMNQSDRFIAHVPLPDEKEIEKMILEKKKRVLLDKYVSEALVSEEVEAKQLLNIRR